MAMRSIRQLRSQTVPLRPAGPPNSTDLLEDPGNIGVTTRGLDKEMAYRLAGEGSGVPIGPLQDPRWAGFFQALQEKDAHIGPSVGERGSAVHEFGPDTSGTAGDALAGVAGSMSGQPGSMQALALATRQRQAKEAADAKAAADAAVQANAPQPPKAQPAPPRPGTAPQQLDPTLARTRYQAGQMQPGSLASLRRTLYGGE